MADHEAFNKPYKPKISVELAEAALPVSRMVLSIVFILLVDLIAVAFSAITALLLRNLFLPQLSSTIFADKLLDNTMHLLWWYPLAFIFSLAYEKLYLKRLPFWIEVELILRSCTLALFMAIAFIYLTGLAHIVSRSVLIMVWLLAMLLIPLGRFYGKKLLLSLNLWTCPLILIGDQNTATIINRALDREKTMGYYLTGFINGQQDHGHRIEETSPDNTVPYLGSLDEAEQLIIDNPARDLIIARPGLPADELVDLTNRFQPLVNNIIIIPDLFGISLNGIEVAYFFEEQVVFLQVRNRLKSLISRTAKRIFDLFFGSILIVLASPVLLISGLAIILTSPGPAIYIQKRIGQGGSEFNVYKFRTMFNNADQILASHLSANKAASLEWQRYQKLKSYDPRVTKVGRLLRRFSLDELPQLFNVLKNNMSLVGPRPYLPREREQLSGFAREILVTKPGLTGLWQVSGRNNLSFKSRLRLDAWYVRNWSVWLDIMLILKTLRVVIKTDGAY